jgi:hypothetical protein
MIRDDVLIDIGTFLIKAWSGKNAVVKISKNPRINYEKSIVSIPNLDVFSGEEFSRYRQWRVACWILAIRL